MGARSDVLVIPSVTSVESWDTVSDAILVLTRNFLIKRNKDIPQIARLKSKG